MLLLLLFQGKMVVSGARVRDEISGKEWDIQAKCVINATGPLTDSIRLMDDVKTKSICCPSSGVHIVLPGYYRLTKILSLPSVAYMDDGS